MSTLDGTFAFAINNTTQANFQVDPNDPNSHGGFWTDVTSNLDTFLLNSSPQSNGVFSTQATGIGLDPFYSGVAYIALSGFTADTMVGHIYKTVDFGTNWKEADGNAGTTLNPTGLPDVPVLKILVDATDSSGTCGGFTCSNSLFAGTDIGIFHSSDGGATWQPFNLGVIPPVPVYDMAQNSTGVIFAGTHGRGAFRFIPATPTATATPTPTATATPNGAKIIAPASVTLGPIGIGVGQSTRNIVIRNSGKVGNLIGGVALNSPSQVFSFSPTTFNLAPGKLQPVAVTFNPDVNSSSATTPAMATITSNDATRGALQLKLTGRGLAGRLTVARTVTLVGPANQTTPLNLTIRNSGRGILSGSWSSVSSPPYSVNGNLFGPLQPGGTTTIPVSFSPTAKGRVPTTAPLTISVNLPSTGGTTVTLRGLGK